jgi:hypothetical protein
MSALHRTGAIAMALCLGPAACDLPTELPRWDTEWDVVVLSDTIATAELIPDEMRVTGVGFVLDSFDSDGQVRLRDVCELCTCFDGPIPPLEIAPHDWPIRLPGGLVSAMIEEGTAEVVIHNEVGFDVLDDGEGNRGFMMVELVDSWTEEVISEVRLAEAFPPGDSLLLTFDLPAIELSSRIVARVSGETPGSGCDSVDLEPESGFRTRVRLRDVVSHGVEVILSDRDLAITERDFELPGWLADRLRPDDAQVVLEVDVDTSVPASFELDLSAATRQDDLFTERAALFTPLLLPNGEPEPHAVRKDYLLDLTPLHEGGRLFFSSDARVVGNRIVTLDGDESVAYRVRLRARVPSR